MRFAVLDIEFAERNAPALLRPGDFDLGSERQQGRCQIAGEGGMAALALRRHMADLAAVLEAVAVGVPPPLTLIVEDAARIEAQIAADRRHGAVARAGDRLGGFGQGAITLGQYRGARQRRDGDGGADPHAGVRGFDAGKFADLREVDQQPSGG